MNAKVIRKISDNSIVGFGPDKPSYDHPIGIGEKLSIEDYDAVMAEYKVQPKPKTVDPKKQAILNDPSVPQSLKDYFTNGA